MSIRENNLRVDYVEFPVTDIEKTKNFYSAAFGWRFEDYGPEYTSFHDGRLAGGFFLSPKVDRGGALVVIYATDLDAMLERVSGAGGKVVKSPFEFPGGRRFHFTDPGGNELAVWSDR